MSRNLNAVATKASAVATDYTIIIDTEDSNKTKQVLSNAFPIPTAQATINLAQATTNSTVAASLATLGGASVLNVGTTSGTVAAGNDSRIANAVPNTTTVNGHALSSNITVTATDVGLGNCQNTSDANKPVSTDQATAIAACVQQVQPINILSNSGGDTIPFNKALNTDTLTQNTTFASANLSAGATTTVILLSDNNNNYNLTFPSGWQWSNSKTDRKSVV